MDWLNIIDNGLDVAKLATAGTPIGAALAITDALVETKTKCVGIDNNEVIKLLESIAKSTHNKVDDRLICIVKTYLECENRI